MRLYGWVLLSSTCQLITTSRCCPWQDQVTTSILPSRNVSGTAENRLGLTARVRVPFSRPGYFLFSPTLYGRPTGFYDSDPLIISWPTTV